MMHKVKCKQTVYLLPIQILHHPDELIPLVLSQDSKMALDCLPHHHSVEEKRNLKILLMKKTKTKTKQRKSSGKACYSNLTY